MQLDLIHESRAKQLSCLKHCHQPLPNILKKRSIQCEQTPKLQYTWEKPTFIFIRNLPQA